MYIKPGQIFFWKNASNSRVKFGPNCDGQAFQGPQIGPILTAFRTFGGLATWLNDFRMAENSPGILIKVPNYTKIESDKV